MRTGYVHRFGKSSGGIRTILLTPVCNIREGSFDLFTGVCTHLSLYDPFHMAECSFGEGAACYREEIEQGSGIPQVLHTLEFETDRMDGESDRLIRELAANAGCGLAAVVTTCNNVRLLIGFSNEHRGERPLRLGRVDGSSGRVHTDPGHEAIRLISRDSVKAGIFSGTIG